MITKDELRKLGRYEYLNIVDKEGKVSMLHHSLTGKGYDFIVIDRDVEFGVTVSSVKDENIKIHGEIITISGLDESARSLDCMAGPVQRRMMARRLYHTIRKAETETQAERN